ncbi:hypothetical protein Tco_0698996 [Tanacetum coccineum]
MEETNIAWDDIQAKIDADYQLAQRLQAQEQKELTIRQDCLTELVEESSKKAEAEVAHESSLKRAGEELEQGSYIKQIGRKTMIQIFYDHVNPATRQTIDQAASGKLRDKNTKESWALLEDLALYDNESWNDPRDFAKPVNAISLPQYVPSTSDRCLIELENQV